MAAAGPSPPHAPPLASSPLSHISAWQQTVSNGSICHSPVTARPQMSLILLSISRRQGPLHPSGAQLPNSSSALWLLCLMAPQCPLAWYAPHISQAGDLDCGVGNKCLAVMLPSPAAHLGVVWGHQQHFSTVSGWTCCLSLHSPGAIPCPTEVSTN